MFQVIYTLAVRQHGAFSTSQAEARRVTRQWLSRNCRAGVFDRRAHGVYVIAGTPDTARQRLMVHVLAAGEGAMVTGDAGLALWVPELEMPREPVLAVPRSCGYRHPDVVVRRSSDLHLAKPGVVDGIPVVGVARALLDASVDRSPDGVLRLIGACRRHLPMSTGALLEALRLHARPGRPGIAVYRRALQLLGSKVQKSEFERLVLRDLLAAGVAEPVTNHILRLDGEKPIELDIAWLLEKIDLELDGIDHEKRPLKTWRDRQRDRILQRHGWAVPRVGWDEYVTDPDAIVEEVGELLVIRRRR